MDMNKSWFVRGYWKDTSKDIRPCDVIFVCADSDRTFIFRSKYYSPLTDSLADVFEQNGIKTRSISDRISHFVGNTAYGEPLSANRKLLAIRFAVKALFFLHRNKYSAYKWRIKCEAKVWKETLLLSKPKVVIGIQPDAPLCFACRKLGIPIYDLQHGVISDSSDNLYYWSEWLSKIESNYLPTGFLCWDDNSTKTLSQIESFRGCHILNIGSPWFSRFKNVALSDALVNEEIFRFRNITNSTVPAILLTLQHNIEEHAGDYVKNVIAECLVSVIRVTSKRYRWMIRLHPSQMIGMEKERIFSFLASNFGDLGSVEWSWCSEVALPLLLTRSCLHITHFSSTTIEAAWMGVPTGLIDPHICSGRKHENLYQHERDIGMAAALSLDEKDILAYIDQHASCNQPLGQGTMDCSGLNTLIDHIKTMVNFNFPYVT